MIEDIITDVLKAEGWDKYTNDPADRGGPTKWGITQKAWSAYRGYPVSELDMKEITEEQARDFYEEKYIVEPKFNQLSEMLIPLVVDCGVNHGVSRAAKWLQEAVGVVEDGKVGRKTIDASQARGVVPTYLHICATRVRFYGSIVGKDRSQAKFAKGWNARAAKWLDRLALQLK